MFESEAIERLRAYEGRETPVLSVYLGTRRNMGEAGSVGARLKDLISRARNEAPAWADPRALDAAIEVARLHEDTLIREPGAGVAMFTTGNGMDEYHASPAPYRDRAIVADRPYLRPLDAMLGETRRYCAVVLDRREAHLMRFFMRRLESKETLSEEEVRKANFGGFSGYEERRVRSHADAVVHRHFRDTAARLFELMKEGAFQLVLIGGQQENIDGLRRELHPDVAAVLAGTFSVDTHTMTPAMVREACEPLVEEHDRRGQSELVDKLIGVAKGNGLAVLGLDDVLDAANLKAVGTIVVDTGSSPRGWECSQCRWLQVAAGSGCSSCGGSLVMVPDLVDALVRAVAASSGSVHHILAVTPLAEYQVGAALRFKPSA